MNHHYKKRKPMAEINVVPYIDVMLVLLVIFMITAPLLTQGVKVNLPKAQANTIKNQQDTPIIVSVDQKGEYYLNVSSQPDVPLTPDNLATYVAAEVTLHQDRPVLVKGDKDVPYGKVVEAMVLLQHSGVEKVGLMTEMPDDRGENEAS